MTLWGALWNVARAQDMKKGLKQTLFFVTTYFIKRNKIVANFLFIEYLKIRNFRHLHYKTN